MNKIKIFLVAAALLLSGQTFAQTTKATIQGEISSSTANGLLGGTILNNIVLSYVDWTTCSGTGGIVYWNAGTPTCLNAGNNGYTLTMVSGIPQWTLPGTLGVSGGGTNCTMASGTCLDNITGFSTTGYINRTGSGTYAFSTVIPVSSGGTAIASGTSGGVLGFTAPGTIASSGLLAQYSVVVGGGAGATPSTVANGTAGQIFQAQTSANPAWNTLSGDATITSAGALTVSAGAITNSKLANAGAYTFKGNATSGSAAPTDFTPGSLANKASPAAGDFVVIADNAASGALKYATVSSIGSAGSVASIAGNTGSFTLAGGITNVVNQIQFVSPPTAQGRLTGQANTPVMATTQSNITTLRYDCYVGNGVPYFDGTYDQVDTIASCEVTDAMVSAASAGQIVSGQVYDVWWAHNGANRICIAMSASTGGGGGWASDTGGSNTARGTGYTQLDRTTRSYPTNANTIANCFNGATNYGSLSANRATYLGTIYANANGQTSWNIGGGASGGVAGILGIWNFYNRVGVSTISQDNGANYTYSSATWRQARGSTTNNVSFVIGLAEETIALSYGTVISTTNVIGSYSVVAVGFDITSGSSLPPCYLSGQTGSSGVLGGCTVSGVWQSPIGFHTAYAIEYSDGSHATTFDSVSDNTLSLSTRM